MRAGWIAPYLLPSRHIESIPREYHRKIGVGWEDRLNSLRTRDQRILVSVAVALLLAGAVALAFSRHHNAPDVTFIPLVGTPVSTQDLRGKVVLVNFWATTCTICAAELPEVISTYQTFAPRGFEIMAVAMSYDPAWLVAEYATKKRLPFKVALDTRGDVERAFGGIEGTPTSFLIGKKGEILEKIVGRPDFERLRSRIERELAAKG
jgi:peroxiredoxin